ncbi:hypothetical protein V2J09_001109 [Rumex salicifolius]
MRDFPSCFGENAVQISDSSSSNGNKTAQNLVTCVYQCRLRGRSCLITIAWSKSLMGQGLNIAIDDSNSRSLCRADIKWLFSKRRGSKTIELNDSRSFAIHWDLSTAKFGSRPEPFEGFYLAIVFDRQIILLLGDMRKEALKKTGSVPSPNKAVFVSKREHIYGKKVFLTKVQFCDNGQSHDLMVECDTVSNNDPCLIIKVDRKNAMQIKRLKWKFRGNQTILVEGLTVEVFWDVHNWLFSGASSTGSAVFMFKTRINSAEKIADPNVLQWSNSQKMRDCHSDKLGFSLILHAWKQE